jgi:inosine triphosphate pyrophosphatase
VMNYIVPELQGEAL